MLIRRTGPVPPPPSAGDSDPAPRQGSLRPGIFYPEDLAGQIGIDVGRRGIDVFGAVNIGKLDLEARIKIRRLLWVAALEQGT